MDPVFIVSFAILDIYMVQLCSLMFPNSQSSDIDGDHEIDVRCKNWFEDAVYVCSRKLFQPDDYNLWKTLMKMFHSETALVNSKTHMFLDPGLLTIDDCRHILKSIVKNYLQIVPQVPLLRDEIFYLHSCCLTFLNILVISIFIVVLKKVYKGRKRLPRLNKTTMKNIRAVTSRAGRFNLARSMCETKIFHTQSLRNSEHILESAQILTTKVTKKKFMQTLTSSLRSNDGCGDEKAKMRGKLHKFLSNTTKCCVILSFELEESVDDEDDFKENEGPVPNLKLNSPPKYLSQVYSRPRFLSHGSGDGHTTPPTKKMCLLRSSKCSAEYDSTSMKSDCSALSMASTNSKRATNFRMRNSGTPTSSYSKDAQSPRSVCNSLSQASTNRSSKTNSQIKKPKSNLFVTKKYKDS